jgi:hypothetical protein
MLSFLEKKYGKIGFSIIAHSTIGNTWLYSEIGLVIFMHWDIGIQTQEFQYSATECSRFVLYSVGNEYIKTAILLFDLDNSATC